MTTFDGWNTLPRKRPLAGSNGQLSDDELMHFRTKGSKNGVRRYQMEDGTWTPLGLRERKAREGWGESRKERKLAKKVARAEKHEAKKAARSEAKAERAEKRRQRSLSGLTDDEMKKKLERARMEAEYRDLKKRGTMIESGTKLIGKYLDYRDQKVKQTLERNRQMLELERLRTQKIQAKQATKKSKYEAKTAMSEAVKQIYNTKGGQKYERKASYQNAKTNYRNTTIRGAIGKMFNNRAKYIHENRMNPIEAKKHKRTMEMVQAQLERDKERTAQERAKAHKK